MRLSISIWVTAVVVVLIGTATATVGVSGQLSTASTVDVLWHDLGVTLADRTTGETMRFLDRAVPFTELSSELMKGGELAAEDTDRLLRYLEAALDANPDFTWVEWGSQSGSYLSVYRWPEDGVVQVRRTRRRVLGPNRTWFKDEVRTPDGSWALLEEHEGKRFYDPRVRPWYKAAVAAGEGVWTDPYVFLSRNQPGIGYTVPVYDGETLIGVWCVEFEIGPLSSFLSELGVGDSGRVYILDSETGDVIAHPEGQTTRGSGQEITFITAPEHPDEMLREAWAARMALPEDARNQPYAYAGHLALAEHFPAKSEIPWVVLTVVPEEAYLGHAHRQARRSLLVGVGAVLIAILLGVFMGRRLTHSVRALQEALGAMAQLELTGQPVGLQSSFAEIYEMGEATERMRQGLRAFSRYVPHQLVRQLLASGRDARLGAERVEVTVLFSDIAGFTTIVESTPPAEMLDALGGYLDAMNTAIGSTDGTVCQYLGDAIMAFWGAPEPVPEQAVRACLGALAMRREVDRLVVEAEAAGTPVLRTRIALETGPVLVGNIGASERFNYGILGDTVNTTARLEGINKVYGTGILVGERARAQAGQALVFRRIDKILPKGKTEPLWIYELVDQSVSDDVQAAIDTYETAWEAYADRRFTDAIALFDTVTETLHDDPPSAVMRARCEAFSTSPPPADWSGVHILVSK